MRHRPSLLEMESDKECSDAEFGWRSRMRREGRVSKFLTLGSHMSDSIESFLAGDHTTATELSCTGHLQSLKIEEYEVNAP